MFNQVNRKTEDTENISPNLNVPISQKQIEYPEIDEYEVSSNSSNN